MTLSKLSATVGSLAVLIGAVFAVDNFYMRRAEAGEIIKEISAQAAKDRKTAALANAQNKLAFLTAKKERTEDDVNEIDFLRDQIKRLRAELQ